MKLVSFDIFDTTLIRKCGKPENIFFILAYNLYPENKTKQEAFRQWRISAERIAKEETNNKELSLHDIYASSDLTYFDEYTINELIGHEKDTEADNLTVNPQVKDLIEKHRIEDKDVTICFISDMYIDSDFLSEILKREECLKGDEIVWVSCEHMARKSDGKLYDNVKEFYKPDLWSHYGDNKHSDIKKAEQKGIQATFVDTAFNEKENKLIQLASTTNHRYELSTLAGIERLFRIKNYNDPFTSFAANFIGPAYIPYVQFVLNKVKEEEIKHLYFLSRDSYILMQAALEIIPESIKTHYLFVSRHSLLLPYIATDLSAKSYLAAMDRKTIVRQNISKLLSQLGTNRSELSEIGIDFPYEYIGNTQEEKDFLEKIFHSPYTETLRVRAEDALKLILDYFKQESLLDGEKTAMVDIGWIGTSRLMINRILKYAEQKETFFYYFAIRSDVIPAEFGLYQSFLSPDLALSQAAALIENYFSASPYPTTIGYTHDTVENKIKPLFPPKKEYKETAVTKANTLIITQITKLLKSMPYINESAYQIWGKYSVERITYLDINIDISPLTHAGDFDSQSFVRKLTINELFLLTCWAAKITVFDRASLYLTCGKDLTAYLWSTSRFILRVKRFVYRQLKKI